MDYRVADQRESLVVESKVGDYYWKLFYKLVKLLILDDVLRISGNKQTVHL